MSKSVRARLMASSMIGGLAIFAAPVAFAADATSSPLATTDSGASVNANGNANGAGSSIQTITATADAPPAADTAGTATEVVVTGSRIPQPNLTAISPVQTTSSAVVKFSGAVNTVDVLDQLPQNSPSFGQFESNGATGTATVDLRDLGSNRTLVLINGLRVGGQDPTEVSSYVPDINFIPPTLIDRIDVLTGGASAVYGSDAVAGVVNFVMKTNYEGLQVDGQVSAFEYDGGTPNQIAAANAQGVKGIGPHNSIQFAPQTFHNGVAFDGENYNLNIIGGSNTGDGKGNVEFYLGYTEIRAVLEAARPYMQCGLSTNTSNTKQQYCGGSANDASGLISPTTGPNALGEFNILGKPVGGLLPAFNNSQDFNFAPLNFIQRPDQRYTGGEFSHYEVSNALDIYSSFMFMDDNSTGQVAPSGSFFGDDNFAIPCNDPLLSKAQANTLCGAAAGTNAIANASIGRRNVEGAPRSQTTEHFDFRMVVGARGDIGDGWHYDVSDEFSRSALSESEGGYFSNSKLLEAVNVETDAANGKPECATFISGADTSCVPYNIFSPGGVTAAAEKFLTEVAAMSSATQQNDLLATLSNGDLSRYGLKSPWANDSLGVSVGAEFRIDQLKTDYDSAFQSGDLAGFGGALQNTDGSQSDEDVFGELHVPIIQDMPLAKDFSADLGYRYSNYAFGGGNSTYKIGFDYAPISDIRFRTSYERAVRAPNVLELFEPDVPGLFAGQDPCAGPTPSLTAAQCFNTIQNTLKKNGISMTEASFAANVFGKIPLCPAAQCGNFSGGNTSLKPEEADTVSVGFVLTPSFIHNLSITVDFFNIVVNNAIIPVPATTILRNCGVLDSAFDCSQISRDPNEGFSIFGGNGAGSVTTPLVNASKLSTDGVDVQGDYRLRLEDAGLQNAGSLDFNFNGTYTATLTTFLPDGTGYDCVGLYGLVCGIPTPKWRHDMRVTWDSPWNLQISANWRFIGSSSLDFNTNVPDLQDGAFKDSLPTDGRIPTYSYLDLAFKYRINDKVALRGGVNNVLDTVPPLLDSNSFGISAPPFGNGNTYPELYDPLGRMMFIGFTADL
jgi:iron complex outermembrane recepter protein